MLQGYQNHNKRKHVINKYIYIITWDQRDILPFSNHMNWRLGKSVHHKSTDCPTQSFAHFRPWSLTCWLNIAMATAKFFGAMAVLPGAYEPKKTPHANSTPGISQQQSPLPFQTYQKSKHVQAVPNLQALRCVTVFYISSRFTQRCLTWIQGTASARAEIDRSDRRSPARPVGGFGDSEIIQSHPVPLVLNTTHIGLLHSWGPDRE
jgi:hypothetical protein